MKILGLEIERKTDFLAFAAFILSMLTVFYQVGVHLIGPDGRILKPEGATLMQFEPKEGVSYVSVLAPVSILNASGSPEPLLVRNLIVTLDYADKKTKWEWHRRVEGVEAKPNRIEFGNAYTVGPFAVDSKKVQTSFYLFVPHSRPCGDGTGVDECNRQNGFISIRDFKSQMKSALMSKSNKASLLFEAIYENHAVNSVKCVFEIDPVAFLRLRKSGYVAFLCQ